MFGLLYVIVLFELSSYISRSEHHIMSRECTVGIRRAGVASALPVRKHCAPARARGARARAAAASTSLPPKIERVMMVACVGIRTVGPQSIHFENATLLSPAAGNPGLYTSMFSHVKHE